MRPNDFVVQVRDKSLARVGTITPKYLDLKATVRHIGVGDWTLKLPRLHPMVDVLGQPGAGITVAIRGESVFSGPSTTPSAEFNRENPDGTFTFTGVTDDILLDDALAYPDPSVGTVAGQTTRSNDTRVGNGEDLIREYVALNIMPGYAAAERVAGLRQYLALDGASQSRGAVVPKSPRFQKLSELCAEIAVYCGLRFHIVQVGQQLVLKVSEVVDRSDLVRFDIRNGTLASETATVSAPTATRAIVAGGGEGTARAFVQRVTADSAAAETAWGRPIEVFVDQRQTEDTAELEAAGDKTLIENGTASTAIKAVPSDDSTMLYGVDWSEGDRVGVVLHNQPQPALATVSAVAFVVNSDATLVGAAIGDVSRFNAADALVARVEDTEKRVGSLERNAEVGVDSQVEWADILGKPLSFPPDTSGENGRLAKQITGYRTAYTDWNDVKASGWYGGDSWANAPQTGWIQGVVVAHDDTYVHQEVWNFTSAYPVKWHRQCTSGTWNGWRRIGDWSTISGKPSTFAPSAHTHDDRYYTDAEADARFQPKAVDTNYLTISYASGFSTQGSVPVGVRLEGHKVSMRGLCARTGSFAANTLYVIGTLPDSRFWPKEWAYMDTSGSNATVGVQVVILNDGNIRVVTGNGGFSYIEFGSLSWDVDQ